MSGGDDREILERIVNHPDVLRADERVKLLSDLLLSRVRENDTDANALEMVGQLKAAWNLRCRRVAAIVDASRRPKPKDDDG